MPINSGDNNGLLERARYRLLTLLQIHAPMGNHFTDTAGDSGDQLLFTVESRFLLNTQNMHHYVLIL